MGSKESEVTLRSRRNSARRVADRALLRLLEPLTAFFIDAGLGVSELESLLRQAAVRSVAARQREVGDRVNIAGISATTGIPRAAITKILKAGAACYDVSTNRHKKSTNRILEAWHAEPKFIDSNGKPADLKLYGRGATFEALVKIHGGGIPARAVLDELIRVSAVEVLPSQKIRAKSSFAMNRQCTPQVIKAFGDRASQLLSLMLSNVRWPDNQQLIASVSKTSIDPNALELFRNHLTKQSA